MPDQWSTLSLSKMKPTNAFDFRGFSIVAFCLSISSFVCRLLLFAVVKKHLCTIIKSNATPTHVAIVIATFVVAAAAVAIVARSHSSVEFWARLWLLIIA